VGDFSGDERRRQVRVSTWLVVRLRLGEREIAYSAAFTRDLSTSGLGIEIGARLPDSYDDLKSWQGPLGVEIDLPSGHTVNATAEMMWSILEEEGGEGRFKAGLRFLDLDPADHDRLADFVKAAVDDRYRRKHEHGRRRAGRRRRRVRARPGGPEARISFERTDGVLVVKLTGPWTLLDVDRDGPPLAERLTSDECDVVIDLSMTEQIDSYVLGQLVEASVMQEKAGRRLVVAGATGHVLRTLELLGTKDLLGCFLYVETAVEAVQKR
jgi:anti-anti-sigma regulatory factor